MGDRVCSSPLVTGLVATTVYLSLEGLRLLPTILFFSISASHPFWNVEAQRALQTAQVDHTLSEAHKMKLILLLMASPLYHELTAPFTIIHNRVFKITPDRYSARMEHAGSQQLLYFLFLICCLGFTSSPKSYFCLDPHWKSTNKNDEVQSTTHCGSLTWILWSCTWSLGRILQASAEISCTALSLVSYLGQAEVWRGKSWLWHIVIAGLQAGQVNCFRQLEYKNHLASLKQMTHLL